MIFCVTFPRIVCQHVIISVTVGNSVHFHGPILQIIMVILVYLDLIILLTIASVIHMQRQQLMLSLFWLKFKYCHKYNVINARSILISPQSMFSISSKHLFMLLYVVYSVDMHIVCVCAYAGMVLRLRSSVHSHLPSCSILLCDTLNKCLQL